MATPNYNDPRAGTNAFSIGQQELLRLKNRIGFIEEAFEKLDDDPTDAIPTKLSELQNDVGFVTTSDRIANIETWKNDQTETFGADYTIRAVWNGDIITLKCINPPSDSIDYWITVPYSERVPWTGVMNAPDFITSDDVPTKTSDLTNDSGFITADDIPEGTGGTVPTKTSDLTNDSGFITTSDRIANMETWKGDQSATFGADYTIRAVWNGDVLTFKCINPPDDTIDYWVTVPYSERVPWSGVMNAPEFVTRAEVEAMIAEALS